MIKALIFDFDGLILDTEGAEYRSWCDVFEANGCKLHLEKWAECIGTAGAFDPHEYLEQLSGQQLDRTQTMEVRRARFNELMAGQPLLPGVESYIAEAQKRGMKLGVASSSTREWVLGYLTQYELAGRFHTVRCRDDVRKAKPDPELYLSALSALGLSPQEAIALEDSPNGILAAKRAGLFCVAVPNPLTRQLSLAHADLQVASLAELPLTQLLATVQPRRG